MNLEELDNLINDLMKDYDNNLDLIQFYTNKRLELVGMIFTNINNGLEKMQEDKRINNV